MSKPFDPDKLDGSVKAFPLPAATDESPEAKRFREILEKSQKCATAVGNLCFAWSALEGKIDDFIKVVLSSPDESVADMLLAAIDARDKMRIALGLGSLRRASDEWFEVLRWCIARTDGDLRSRRNRFVHDRVWVGPDGLKRVQRKTDRKSGEFVEIREDISAEDVWKLVEEIQSMVVRFDCLLSPARRKDWRAGLEKHGLMPSLSKANSDEGGS